MGTDTSLLYTHHGSHPRPAASAVVILVCLPQASQIHLYTLWLESTKQGDGLWKLQLCQHGAHTPSFPNENGSLQHKAASFPKCSNFSHDMISWGSKQNYSFFLLISPLTKVGRMGTPQRTCNVASIRASLGQRRDVCRSLLSLRPHKFAAPILFLSCYKKTSFAGNVSECAGNIMLGGERIASSFIQREFQKDS